MVAVTDEMLQAAVFGGDLDSTQELSLTNKSLHTVSLLSSLSSLRELNLAFNSITTLEPLSSLVHLQTLNISHNQLKNLNGLQSLKKLEQLKAGNNKIRQVSAITECKALQALWLQHNELRKIEQLSALQSLDALAHIWLSPNPITASMHEMERRAHVLTLCPSLQSIDSKQVGDAERAAVSALGTSRDEPPHGGEATVPPVERIPGNQPEEDQLPLLHARQRSGSWASGHAGGDGVSGGYPEVAKAATPPKFGRRSSFGSGSPYGNGTSGQNRTPRKKTSALIADDFGIDQVAGLLPQLNRKPPSQLPPRTMGRRNSSTSANRTPPLNGRRKAKSARATDATAAVEHDKPRASSHDALCVDNKELSTAESSNRAGVPGACTPTSRLATGSALGSGLYMTEYEVKYPKGSSSAVIVRGDGSARLSWPNEDVAVSCESEMLAGRKSFRLFVHYRLTGNLAAAFEPDGSGFVQYPGGGIMLIYNIDSGDGTLYSKEGGLERRWNDSGANGLSPLSTAEAVERQLDQFLGVRIAPGSGPAGEGKPQVEVYFSCEGVKHRLVHGPNPAKHVWAASDYDCTRGDGTGGAEPSFVAGLGGDGNPRGAVRKVVVDRRPVDERMNEVSSITSAMHDLDSQLTSWLQSLKPS